MCWAAQTDFFSSSCLFSSQHVCFIHWCLWNYDWHCWSYLLVSKFIFSCFLLLYFCAQLISTQVEIEMCHLTCSFCVCFVLCVLLVRILYLWLDWDTFDNTFTLHVLHVVYASHENLVFVISSFQLKLKLRHVWWLCCQIYSLHEKVMMSLWEDTASNSKKKRWATVKEEDEQQ
jgi:hypothetical protein